MGVPWALRIERRFVRVPRRIDGVEEPRDFRALRRKPHQRRQVVGFVVMQLNIQTQLRGPLRHDRRDHHSRSFGKTLGNIPRALDDCAIELRKPQSAQEHTCQVAFEQPDARAQTSSRRANVQGPMRHFLRQLVALVVHAPHADLHPDVIRGRRDLGLMEEPEAGQDGAHCLEVVVRRRANTLPLPKAHA